MPRWRPPATTGKCSTPWKGLPRFEARFKQLLNENTIREVASFQSQLRREVEDIRERIETINRSLCEIDYERGRYIVLEAEPTTDPEVRDFQRDLRACTEGSLTGSDDQAYSEAKFLEVKRIVERFCGREGLTELDRRWTRKVTDVRSWFVFSASERWRSDDSEHEHYSDSGGKSGGQKEKLAYTILAASLACQFGLDANAPRPHVEPENQGSGAKSLVASVAADRLAKPKRVVGPGTGGA